MKNAITTLRIQNFKSIKDVEIKPRRVNLILGEPNVGKSNVLEAISLLGGMVYDKQDGKFMDGQIRYESIENLFYDNDWSSIAIISGDSAGTTQLKKQEENVRVVFERNYSKKSVDNADMSSVIEVNAQQTLSYKVNRIGIVLEIRDNEEKKHYHVRKYNFKNYSRQDKSYVYNFLSPPIGDNLLEVIKSGSSEFRKEIAPFFTSFGLNLALRMESRSLEIQKNTDGLITSIPYSLIADTLQRLIFYLAAIESNNDAVLLFEEPEAHSFPTYVSQLGRRIVDSENNQFFVVTHSPYLVTEILEEMVPNDESLLQLAIFVAYYEDYQTKIRQLTDDEVRTVRANGTEMFYNLRQFTPAGQE